MSRPFQLVHGDCVEVLKTLDDASVDLVITDPAYESLEKHRKVGTTTRLAQSKSSSNEWFRIFPNVRFPELFSQLFRVMKPDTHLYLMCDQETAFAVKPMGEAAGFKFWKPLVWDKQKIGMGYHYRARYELVLFFEKVGRDGGRQLNDLAVPDVLSFPRVRYEGSYPTEKPVELSRVLVRQSSSPGDVVLDTFAGSSSVGEASLLEGRSFLGLDLSESAVARGRARLEAIGGTSTTLAVPKRQQDLFGALP